jgi:multicomponent Na+:H+ antiporter subunit D
LSFHIVSQLGYVFFGVVMSGLWAFAAAVFFLIHNILVKTALFMISGIVERSHNTDNLADLGQVLKERPFLGAAFFLTAMSLAGIPPLSGFWGKLLIIKTGLSQHFFMTTAASLVVSLFTAYSMLKIWRYGFCENHATETIASTKVARKPLAALAPLVILPIIIGLAPDIVLKPLMSAGDQFGQSIALAHKELM